MKFFQLIPSGQFGLENVAEEFGISGRTLQRNLSSENTSFNQLVKDIQKIMTFNYLEEKELSIDEIAYLVDIQKYLLFTGHLKNGQENSIAVS